ncbi:hypothetical protein MNEG_6563 [Monoraphidium neglectum]|uniref:Uncharacterized protein n=1 Tax=Monoraphidium neglectum TaxID=145388 RepID=A0A0D2MDW9_9CHLO|nr:hypothetical protein MNEG_6563 [Monoraphidium neglectum]KIZ01395.1 hypothetical protein MNEG_6563 [Monoraphidium neglectum]|eukprot:XP_013900414.1 hypothetical protein MNEG_6563 [Monoraphidium neglectum]
MIDGVPSTSGAEADAGCEAPPRPRSLLLRRRAAPPPQEPQDGVPPGPQIEQQGNQQLGHRWAAPATRPLGSSLAAGGEAAFEAFFTDYCLRLYDIPAVVALMAQVRPRTAGHCAAAPRAGRPAARLARPLLLGCAPRIRPRAVPLASA